MSDKLILPEHIGIIMDGNGRWAKKRGLPRNAGHKKGAEVFENISRCCRDLGIKYLTVYAFSTENWKRPKEEVEGIMNLMRSYLKGMAKAKNEHIAVRFIGDREPFGGPPALRAVGACTEELVSVLQEKQRDVVFEWNRGGHHKGIENRWRKALRWAASGWKGTDK